RVEAAAAGVPRILEGGEAELDLGAGQRRRARLALRQLRQLEGRGAQAPVVGLAHLGHGVARLGVEPVGRNPQQRVVAVGVEGKEGGPLGVAPGRFGQLPAHLGEHRVDGGRRLLGDGRRDDGRLVGSGRVSRGGRDGRGRGGGRRVRCRGWGGGRRRLWCGGGGGGRCGRRLRGGGCGQDGPARLGVGRCGRRRLRRRRRGSGW